MEKLEKAMSLRQKIVKNKNITADDVACSSKDELMATMRYDDTLLHIAVILSNLNNVNLLLEAGANVNALNKEHDTPLHFASNIDIAKKLIDYGADVKTENKSRQCFIDHVVHSENIGLLEYMFTRNILDPVWVSKRIGLKKCTDGKMIVDTICKKLEEKYCQNIYDVDENSTLNALIDLDEDNEHEDDEDEDEDDEDDEDEDEDDEDEDEDEDDDDDDC